MFRKRKKQGTGLSPIPVPAKLPPLKETEPRDPAVGRRFPRSWLWAFVAAWAVVLLVLFVAVLGVRGIYDGMKERTIANRQIAQQHFDLGLAHLEAGEYELAIAEFELAGRRDPNFPDLKRLLRQAEELAQSQALPTSETRLDAAATLYEEATAQYKSGNLDEVVAALEELRGLDADFQRQNVETMLSTARYQLGLNAVREDRLDDAEKRFQAVLELQADATIQKNAQEQLNLLSLYKAALSHWGQDWSAAIQTLKGLYALTPDYKDVRTRLHDAYLLHGQEYADRGEWCPAAEEYAAAVEVFPLEETVDRRDDAVIQCQIASAAPTPAATPAALATARPGAGPPTAGATARATQATPTRSLPALSVGTGRIVYPVFDADLRRLDLYQVDLPAGTTSLLRENATQPDYGPGGKRLAFRNLHPSYLGIGIVDAAGNLSEVTAHAEDSAPTWSPDASQIVFASDKEGDRKWRLYVISPGEVRGEGRVWGLGQMPAWSPGDATTARIAYRGCDERGDKCGLWTMEAGGFGQTPLTTDPNDTAPSWSPVAPEGGTGSRQLAFISTRAGNWEVYVVELAKDSWTAEGRQVRRMSNHPATDVAPVWSPDGKRLAFLSNRDGSWGLYVLDVRSGQVQRIVAAGDPYPDPIGLRLAWIP